MNAYFDERRAYAHVVELRKAAATERLVRAGTESMPERLARRLRAWASWLDGFNAGRGEVAAAPEEVRCAVPSMR